MKNRVRYHLAWLNFLFSRVRRDGD
jgi:hypothetical protein